MSLGNHGDGAAGDPDQLPVIYHEVIGGFSVKCTMGVVAEVQFDEPLEKLLMFGSTFRFL